MSAKLTWNRAEKRWTLRDVEPGVDQNKDHVAVKCRCCGTEIGKTVRFDSGQMIIGALEFTPNALIEAQ